MIQKSHWSTLWKVTSSFICDPFEREKQRRRATTAEISLLHFNFELHRRRKQRGRGTGALSRPGLGSEESGVFGRPSKEKHVVPCILVVSNREKANTVDAEGGGSTLLETTLFFVTSSFICDPFEREKQRRRATTAEISLLHFNFELHRRRKQRGHGTGALSRPGLGSEESGVLERPSKKKYVVPYVLVVSNREKANTVDGEGGGSTLLETTKPSNEEIRKQSERPFFGNEEMKNTIWRWE
ncbi:hypothetical protein NL676_009673 [Syzygium grande]|nr:hypothetical protein NL676_009673 [Syzygium grande]